MSRLRNLFLYGTLMDREILALALGRAVDVSRLTPARLPGHRRGFIAGRDFPGLKAEPGHETTGVLLGAVSRAEVMRLNMYEGPHYRLVPVEAAPLDQDARIAAHAYVLKPGLKLGAAWDMETWQRIHKPAYMKRWFG